MTDIANLPGAGAGPGPKRAAETTQTKPTRATSTAVLMSAYCWWLKLDETMIYLQTERDHQHHGASSDAYVEL